MVHVPHKRCGRSPDSCLCPQLEGPIPVELGFLEDLKELSIDHNLLTYVHITLRDTFGSSAPLRSAI